MYSFRQIREALVSVAPGQKPVEPDFKGLARAPHLQTLIKEIRAEAESAAGTPTPDLPFSLFQLFETQGTRLEFETPYFARRSRLAVLTLATLLDETAAYLPALENEIWEICLEYSWALPAHLPVGVEESRSARVSPRQTVDLFAAETAHQLAETLNWLGNRLNPWLDYRVREEIEQRFYRPLFYDPHHFWWESSTMNWAAVCSGAVGLAALSLETDRERLAGMVERIARTMESFLEGFGEDGGCPEGINYWTYGFGYFVYFAEALRDFTSGQLDLLESPRVKNIANFPNTISLGHTNWVNYSDAPAQLVLETGLVSRLVERLGIAAPALETIPGLEKSRDHPRFRWVHLTRNLAWTDPTLLQQPTPPGTFYLPNIQWVISRHYFGSKLIAFSAKGGHNNEPHNHNDLGQFLLFAGDESLLCELGSGLYTRDYFRENRYTYLHPSSLGHSVPVINGQAQEVGAAHFATVLEEREFENGLVFELDLTEAYPAEARLEKFIRRFEWRVQPGENQAGLELTDRFTFSGEENSLGEAFISLIQPVLGPEKISWQGRQGRLALSFDPGKFSARVEAVQALAKDGDLITVYRVWLDWRSTAANPEITGHFRFRFEDI
ncbi:MAG: heparinase II/III family protein [Chloroflexi bacterium]|nr:heparinase II/III family protein [Chloroflexota bacterium]OJV92803.1 MAG: hypothetical protein BGO39_30030 [Chloroflexi bacterium 54-19]